MIRKLGKFLLYVILLVVFVASIFAFFLPKMTDYKLAVVRSGSMEPAMPVGSLALMEPVEPNQIKVGDIIAFKPFFDPQTIVSHRVVEVLRNPPILEFRTKGDANEDPDIFAVSSNFVVGRVTFDIPYLGYALVESKPYVRSEFGFALFIVIPTLLLVGIAVKDMGFMLNPSKARRAKRLKERRERRSRRRSLVYGRSTLARSFR